MKLLGRQVKISIISKIIILIFSLLIVVTLFVSYKNTKLFESIFIDREEANNLASVDNRSVEIDTMLQSLTDKMMMYSTDLLKTGGGSNINFESENEFIALNLYQTKPDVKKYSLRSKMNLSENAESVINYKISELSKYNSSLYSGKIFILNISSKETGLNMAIGLPVTREDNGQITSIAWGVFSLDKILRNYQSVQDREVYLLDSLNQVLAHSSEKLVQDRTDFSKNPIIIDSFKNQVRLKQKYFGSSLVAVSKGQFGLINVSSVPLSVVQGPAKLMQQNAYFLLGIVLSISLVLIYLFAQKLTSPIEKLSELTEEVALGNFNIEAAKVIRTTDEVGALARAFDRMLDGLKERDKIKAIFSKFHGTSITHELMNSETTRRGKLYDVTVFFSDIRGFTDFSEGHSPEEVVAMLNEYFDVMVNIINKHGGVVDKFIGDAIMAIWGAPVKGEFDATNAVAATLEMRMALVELNNSRIARGLTPIKIGVGLHSGVAVAGTVGAVERMEYTVIGDTVNTAARIEASTKAFGTDLLISKETFSKISQENEDKLRFVVSEAGKASVQGKSEALSLYKVFGFYDENGVARLVETEYSSYKAEADKKAKVA